MSQKPDKLQEIEQLMVKYLDGEASPEEEARLLEHLDSSEASRSAWVELVTLETLLEAVTIQNDSAGRNEPLRELARAEIRFRPKGDLSALPRAFGIGIGLSLAIAASIFVALLIYDFNSPRGTDSVWASENKLAQIGAAIESFEKQRGGFPAAYSADAEGRPLLSWRVHLLPYLQQQELYDQFHLDEPWDSAHNMTLLASMPDVYWSPFGSTDTKTTYVAVPDPDAVIRPPVEFEYGDAVPVGVPMTMITDGTSNTAVLVEVSRDAAVPWTKPVDYPVADRPPREISKSEIALLRDWKELGWVHCRLVLMADYSTRQIGDEGGIARHWITKSGGDPSVSDSDVASVTLFRTLTNKGLVTRLGVSTKVNSRDERVLRH